MLKESLAQAGNLMDTNYAFPCKMIAFFAEKEPNTVRACFSDFWTLNQMWLRNYRALREVQIPC